MSAPVFLLFFQGSAAVEPPVIPPVEDEDDFVTYGLPAVPKVKRPPLVVVRSQDDTPRLRKLRNERIKLDREGRNLQRIYEQMRQSVDDRIAMETLRAEAEKTAAQFARVAGDYLSIHKRRNMMAMMMALLMD